MAKKKAGPSSTACSSSHGPQGSWRAITTYSNRHIHIHIHINKTLAGYKVQASSVSVHSLSSQLWSMVIPGSQQICSH